MPPPDVSGWPWGRAGQPERSVWLMWRRHRQYVTDSRYIDRFAFDAYFLGRWLAARRQMDFLWGKEAISNWYIFPARNAFCYGAKHLMKDPQYFDHPVLDHLVETVMQLGSELWTTRRRLEVLEKTLAGAGTLPEDAVEQYMPSAGERKEEAARRDAFVRRVFAGFSRGGEEQDAPPEP